VKVPQIITLKTRLFRLYFCRRQHVSNFNQCDVTGYQRMLQNAAARLIFSMRRSEHITDALISLHWLRVPERIIFKVATLTFRALLGTAQPYMTSQFTRVADMPNRRRLRSASSNQLDVPSFRLPTVGSRAFPIGGAKVWNSLPDEVTSAPSLSTFRRHLKTYLFRCCYNTV